MDSTRSTRHDAAWPRALWFVLLWCAGVGGAVLLALPFRLMVQAAIH